MLEEKKTNPLKEKTRPLFLINDIKSFYNVYQIVSCVTSRYFIFRTIFDNPLSSLPDRIFDKMENYTKV